MKKKITLACSVCLNRNYSTHKSNSVDTERLSVKKYCKHCGKHTQHNETK